VFAVLSCLALPAASLTSNQAMPSRSIQTAGSQLALQKQRIPQSTLQQLVQTKNDLISGDYETETDEEPIEYDENMLQEVYDQLDQNESAGYDGDAYDDTNLYTNGNESPIQSSRSSKSRLGNYIQSQNAQQLLLIQQQQQQILQQQQLLQQQKNINNPATQLLGQFQQGKQITPEDAFNWTPYQKQSITTPAQPTAASLPSPSLVSPVASIAPSSSPAAPAVPTAVSTPVVPSVPATSSPVAPAIPATSSATAPSPPAASPAPAPAIPTPAAPAPTASSAPSTANAPAPAPSGTGAALLSAVVPAAVNALATDPTVVSKVGGLASKAGSKLGGVSKLLGK
jgi:hypothetical protein